MGLFRLMVDKDGKCCHLIEGKFRNRCEALTNLDEKCGTYYCPFYKPEGCADWIRKDGRTCLWLIPPEEVSDEQQK